MRIPKHLRGRTTLLVGVDRDSSRNYMDKVAALAATIPEGMAGRYDFTVRHDADCPAVNGGGYCACDPDVVMELAEAWRPGDVDRR